MYKWEGLNSQNINIIKSLFESIEYEAEESLMDIYNSNNLFKRILLWKNIKFLKINNEYIGFIWFTKIDRSIYRINSFKIISNYNNVEYYEMLLSILRKNSGVTCLCKKNDKEFSILTELGFSINKTIIEMRKIINYKLPLPNNSEIIFRPFEKNKDEKLRCKIQNAIFGDLSRAPLDEEDIFLEECQKYYYNEGCIFVCYKDVPVGYGQIILDNCKAFIVNFGILDGYRNKGLGKALLNYLLNLIHELKLKEVYLKCDSTNENALKLYSSNGFEQYNIIYELYKIT